MTRFLGSSITFLNVFPLSASAMVFVYDYHPAAETLMARHFNNPTHLNGFTSPYNLDGSARPYSAGKGRQIRIKNLISHVGFLSIKYFRF